MIQSKRKKISQGRGGQRTRPIDKNLKTFALAPSATQVTQMLITATFPCTLTGLRWEISALEGTVNTDLVQWGIFIVRDGEVLGTFGIGAGTDWYTPEQNVLAFNNAYLTGSANGEPEFHWSGHTKTMRKMMGGDQLIFGCRSSANVVNFAGVIQVFCKT